MKRYDWIMMGFLVFLLSTGCQDEQDGTNDNSDSASNLGGESVLDNSGIGTDEPYTDTNNVSNPDTLVNDTTGQSTNPETTGGKDTAGDTTQPDTGRKDTGEPTVPGENWSEPMCPHDALDKAQTLYDGTNLRAVSIAIAQARYPIAVDFFTRPELTDDDLAYFYDDTFNPDGKITFDEVVDRFDLAAHEAGHGYDFDKGYKLTESITVPAISEWDSIWFPNAEILDHHDHQSADSYLDTYLTGSIGQQDISTLLSEFNQYTHSLAIGYCMYDDAVEYSGRDGALTMMYYIGLWVKTARLDYPDAYQQLIDNRQEKLRMIVLNWDRAEFWVEQTDNIDDLGIDDDKIYSWVYNSNITDEIDRLRPYMP